MTLKRTEYTLLPLFHKFINEIKKGKHLQRNGKKIKPASIRNYQYLELLLKKFSTEKNFHIRLKNVGDFDQKQFNDEKKYWKLFYISFTTYLYDDLDHHDNYVGRMIKLLRSFFNYLITERGMNVGMFYKKFYAPSEDVDIVVLSPERLNYMIYNSELEEQLDHNLKKVKDIFVFGCAVALRYGDLMALTKSNLESINNRHYIKVQSKKTQTFTRVKLPGFAMKILSAYINQHGERLLPSLTKAYMNKKIKLVMRHYGFTEAIDRSRQKRGIPIRVQNSKNEDKILRFCDVVTTHTMRRSAITTMLSLGMKENLVRQISGHSAGSKEFYRYVAYAQTYIDTEIDQVHQKLEDKKLEFTANSFLD